MAWEKKRSLREALADFKMHSQLAPSDPDGLEALIERIERKMTGRRRHGLISGSGGNSDMAPQFSDVYFRMKNRHRHCSICDWPLLAQSCRSYAHHRERCHC